MKIRQIYYKGEQVIEFKNCPFFVNGLYRYSDFSVLNNIYEVVGILMFENHIYYIHTDGSNFNFSPYQFFEIIDSRHLPNWHMRTLHYSEEKYFQNQIIIGYYELCFDLDHLSRLINREIEALKIYEIRKTEAEKMLLDMSLLGYVEVQGSRI